MSLADRVGAALNRPVARLDPLHGGDLSQVARATLSDGGAVVVKTGKRVETEARMLIEMGAAGAPVPAVLHAEPGLMLLEHLHQSAATAEGWRALGQALACLHRRAGKGYGWAEDHAFGPVQIDNCAAGTWPEFWGQRRLLPLAGCLPDEARARLSRLVERLPLLLPSRPEPALVHGDIWAGNALFSGPRAYLIDPACYHGDSEVDIAMLMLFGQPDPAFFEGYGALRTGWQTRQPLYQLWPALVHLRLFGRGYLGLVERLLARCGA